MFSKIACSQSSFQIEIIPSINMTQSSRVNYKATFEYHANLNFSIKVSKGFEIVSSLGYLQFRANGSGTVSNQYLCYDYNTT